MLQGKQAVNPDHDAAGALRAAQHFNSAAKTKVIGYRYEVDDKEYINC